MKINVMYHLDADDPRDLSADRLSELQYMMTDYILPVDRQDRSQKAHPGLKALSSIKGGNPFSDAEISAIGEYVELLLSRQQQSIQNLIVERDVIHRDVNSLKAYDFLIDGGRDKASAVRKIWSDFTTALAEAKLESVAPRP